MFKVSREVIDHSLTDYIPARDRQVWDQLLSRLREDPSHLRERRIEGTGRRSDGSEFPLEASVNSLEAGEHQFLVTFVRDITDRKAAERRLADARDAALRASVVKSEFLATMSHEIRTPMNGVIGSLDLMLDSELAPELAELASIARTAATDLLAIIDDILDLSKIEADKIERQQAPFDPVGIVEGVVDIVAVAARAKGVAVTGYVDPLLPSQVHGDARLLRQVLVNLAGNAVKFTDAGEVVVRAESQPAPESQALVRFSVTDTGAGIPADAIATLFEPFTQVDDGATTRVQRNRARAGDLVPPGAPDGRQARRRERARARLELLVHAAVRPPRRGGRGARRAAADHPLRTPAARARRRPDRRFGRGDRALPAGVGHGGDADPGPRRGARARGRPAGGRALRRRDRRGRPR